MSRPLAVEPPARWWLGGGEPPARWWVAFVHPGTWRPFRRCWRALWLVVLRTPLMLRPATLTIGTAVSLVVSAALILVLWAIWTFRIHMYLFFGRRYLNFSHRSAEAHASCPACHLGST
jgi:hypothetical protein